jgi:hypothetical protein
MTSIGSACLGELIGIAPFTWRPNSKGLEIMLANSDALDFSLRDNAFIPNHWMPAMHPFKPILTTTDNGFIGCDTRNGKCYRLLYGGNDWDVMANLSMKVNRVNPGRSTIKGGIFVTGGSLPVPSGIFTAFYLCSDVILRTTS